MIKANNIFKKTAIIGAVVVCSSVFAGNEDRVGSAGASQLLINPWARSLGSADAGVATTNGLEATFMNIAGLATTTKTQLKFNYTNWLGSAGIKFQSAGLAQRISDNSVIAVSVQSMSFGEIPITVVDIPEGGIGVFNPSINIFNVGYARTFSSSISGGINFKVISESISNLRSTGVGIDAGIRYVTGEQEQVKFGITLKNIGPAMKYSGDGFATQVNYSSTGNIATLEQRSQSFEIPSCLGIGGGYDFIFNPNNKLTAMVAFTANSFQQDQYRAGLDYGLATEKAAFNFRAGYVYEKNIFSFENRTNSLTGLTAGFSVDAIVGKNKSALGLEYAVRTAGPFGYIHTFGTTISIK
jgi:hypothetical protein